MKKLACLFIPVCIALCGFITGCNKEHSPAIHILRIEGVSWACNLTTSYATFGSSSEFEVQKEVFVAASEGDLLYMNRDDLQLYYRYHSKDGKDLAFIFDTLGPVSVYLNGKLNYLELSGDSSPESLDALTDAELAQLSTLSIQGHLHKDLISSLEEPERQLEGLSLVLEGGSEFTRLTDLLSNCRPEFLVLGDSWHLPEPEGNNIWDGLELLWIQGDVPALSKAASSCKDLESLIISGWEPRPGDLLTLSSLKNLQNLTLAESRLTSLQNIEFPEALQSLNLIGCDTLNDIGQLSRMTGLSRLNLTFCDDLMGMSMLRNHRALRWISFPANIRQQEFYELAGSLNQLEVVELIGCTEISDLTPLGQLEHLKVLSLQLEKEQLAGLDSLTQLEVLILTDELFKDNSVWIKELRASLPQSKIVPGSGICLGSGWLLLLLPLILLFRFTLRRKA